MVWVILAAVVVVAWWLDWRARRRHVALGRLVVAVLREADAAAELDVMLDRVADDAGGEPPQLRVVR